MSADLDELGRTQVLVVCGGVKSILDVPKTLEALETRGVAVAALGTRDFPAFFSLRSPGVDGAPNRAPLRVDSAAEAAAWFGAHRELGLASGCVLAVPNPAPRQTEAVEAATRDALAAARDAGVAGADATPFLLADLERRTAGRSLDANVARGLQVTAEERAEFLESAVTVRAKALLRAAPRKENDEDDKNDRDWGAPKPKTLYDSDDSDASDEDDTTGLGIAELKARYGVNKGPREKRPASSNGSGPKKRKKALKAPIDKFARRRDPRLSIQDAELSLIHI